MCRAKANRRREEEKSTNQMYSLARISDQSRVFSLSVDAHNVTINSTHQVGWLIFRYDSCRFVDINKYRDRMTSSSILIRLSYKTVGQYTNAQLRNINEIPRAPAVYIQPIFILIACMFQSFIWLYGRQIIGWCFFYWIELKTWVWCDVRCMHVWRRKTRQVWWT